MKFRQTSLPFLLGSALVVGSPLRQDDSPLDRAPAFWLPSSLGPYAMDWLRGLTWLSKPATASKNYGSLPASQLDETGCKSASCRCLPRKMSVKIDVTPLTIQVRVLEHPNFQGYKIRVKSPRLCDPGVKQYSGYLDTEDDKHFFFWFVFGLCCVCYASHEFWLDYQVF